MPLALTGFDLPAEIVVLGAITGLTYGLLAVGLTLIYRTSRVINFAHGEMGALPALLIPILVLGHGWNYWLAVPLAIMAAVAAGAATEVLVIHRLRHAPRLIVLVATIGVAQVLFVSNLLIPRSGALGDGVYPTPIGWRLTVGDYVLTPGHVLIFLVAPAAALAVTVFLNQTRLGLGSRAAAENRECASLLAIPVHRVSLVVWSIAGTLAGVSAILVGPTQPLQAQDALGPSLMLRALTAALIGGFVSLPRVFAGGIAIGVVERLVLWNHPTGGVLELLLFLVVIASLLAHRRLGQSVRGGEGTSWNLAAAVRALEPRLRRHPRVARARRLGTGVLVLTVVLLPLVLDSSQQVMMASVFLFAVMGLSLVVLTGFAGQVSLGQFSFVGIGAVVGARLMGDGFPAWVALLYAAIASALVALAIGIPALRVRGLFLAVVTLGFSLAAQRWLFGQDWLGGPGTVTIPRFELLGVHFQDERSYYWLCLVALVVIAAAVARMRATGLGRAMMAVRDNEPSAATFSLSPPRVKLLAFTISGFIAGVAGFLYGGLLVSFDATGFGPAESLSLLVMTVFGGITSIAGAILGAAWVRGIPHLLGTEFALLSSGLGVVLVLLLYPSGLAGAAFRLRDRAIERLTGEPVGRVTESDRQRGEPREPLPVRTDLRPVLVAEDGHTVPAIATEDVAVHYGGNTALGGVSMHAERGEIVGLVGPNGAGKTTLFDVLSGHVSPQRGRAILKGYDVTRLRPEHRARLGLGRSFQQARLFDDLSLADCFKVALESGEPTEFVPSILGLPPSWSAERRKDLRAEELIALLGLGPFRSRHLSELSTGTRRLAELGCIVALGADVVLLDEPTAGIAQREAEEFAPVVREIRDHLDATIVVIDHDLPVISDLVDRLYVLAAGEVIAEGPPAAVRDDPAVVASYLGTDERAATGHGDRRASPHPRRRPLVAATRRRGAAADPRTGPVRSSGQRPATTGRERS